MLVIQLLVMNHLGSFTLPAQMYRKTPLLAKTLEHRTPSGEPIRLYLKSNNTAVFAQCLSTINEKELAIWAQATLEANVGLLYGVGYHEANVATLPKEAQQFWKNTRDIQKEILDLLSVRYSIWPTQTSLQTDPDLKRILAREYPCLAVYEHQNVLPVARPVRGLKGITTIEQAIREVKHPDVLQGRIALVTGLEQGKAQQYAADGPIGRCDSTRQTGAVFLSQCNLNQSGFVVVNISYHPALKAEVDGTPVSLYRTNGVVVGLFVPQGVHDIAIRYSEPQLTVGAYVSLLALLICVALLGVVIWQRAT